MDETPMEDERRKNVDQRFALMIYRTFSSIMAVLMLGVISWMAMNVSHIPMIELKIEDLNDKFDERATKLESDMNSTAKWQTDKLNDHEIRIRALETQKK
jgi:hypothetical protein